MAALIFLSAATTTAEAPEAASSAGASTLALFIIIVAVAAWVGMRSVIRRLRARKARAVVGDAFTEYALEALANAAKIDGRINDAEKAAIATAMREIAGESFEAARVETALAQAKLSKDELVAYLRERGRSFTRDQKVKLLQALLAVFVSDGRFDETEHAALIDYTAAVGFDRQSAPQMLRGLARDVRKGNIV